MPVLVVGFLNEVVAAEAVALVDVVVAVEVIYMAIVVTYMAVVATYMTVVVTIWLLWMLLSLL